VGPSLILPVADEAAWPGHWLRNALCAREKKRVLSRLLLRTSVAAPRDIRERVPEAGVLFSFTNLCLERRYGPSTVSLRESSSPNAIYQHD
jgi:hypothetical protein